MIKPRPYQCSMRQLGVILFFFFLEGVEKNGSGRVERVSSTNTSAKSPQSITTRDHRGVKAVLEKFVVLKYDRKAALRK